MFLKLVALSSLTSLCFAQSPEHDLYVCAAVNKNYVIGSKIVTTSGLLRDDGSTAWQHIGANDPSVVAAAFDPRNHDIIYTVALNGALRTLDGGKHWRIITGWDMMEPKDVCIDPHEPDTLYLGHPGGIAVSKDQGDSWLQLEKGLPQRGKYTQTIEVDRTRKGWVLAGCESGIYLTQNGARSWRRVLKTEETVNDIQQSPHDPNVWAAVTQSAGAWISSNGGRSWKQLPEAPSGAALYNIAFDPTNSKNLAIGSYAYGVLVSEDSGKTWTARNEGLPEPGHVWRVGIHPDTGRLLASVYKAALFVSDDLGRTWSEEGLEGSAINEFIFLPKTSK